LVVSRTSAFSSRVSISYACSLISARLAGLYITNKNRLTAIRLTQMTLLFY
jgi:hypothetical protein